MRLGCQLYAKHVEKKRVANDLWATNLIMPLQDLWFELF